ncbi:MAG: restriction endonuclease subunit S [Verrucomicrobiae bacterium]|nr:restriction endonuclease subunit S [Verrucomicrobiae bacterium]
MLREHDNSVPAAELTEVNLAGVYSFARGLFKRGPMSPSETSYKSYNRLISDDFVISTPKAWEGALALVTPEFDGWFLSPVFPTFRANRERLLPKFLEWYCKRKSVWGELQRKSRGIGARRESVHPEQFLSLEIPLPPLPEQRRVVGRIDELEGQIQEALNIRMEATEESEALLRSIITYDKRVKLTPMRELVKLRPPDVTVCADETYQFAGVYCFGRGVFKALRKSGMDFAYPHLTRLRAGEFVYPKLMAWEGAFGVVPPECTGCVVSPEFPVFEVNEDRVLHEVLDVFFRSPSVWSQVAGKSTGTNIRRRRLNPQDFLDYEMPLPSRETQMTLRKINAEVDTLKRLQAETAAKLDALLPSILDRAFKGEL